MINSVLQVECSECHGHGIVFFGNDYDYDCEPCDCVDTVNDELNVDWIN